MAFFRFLPVTVIISLVLGCHSTPLKGPQVASFEGADQKKWLHDYVQARSLQDSDPNQACKLFKPLSLEQKFPAHQLAELRSWQTCSGIQVPAAARLLVPNYLKTLSLDISLKVAQDQKDTASEMELAAEKSKAKLPQNEKIKWMNLALARAFENKNDDKIEEYTKRLYQLAPRLNPEPKESNYLNVAADFRLARQFEKSRTYYERVIANPETKIEDKIAAFKGIRLGYKNARQNEEHIAACEHLASFLDRAIRRNPKVITLKQAAYEAEVYHARALWTQGHADQARNIFSRLERRMKGKVAIAELYWLKARMAEEEKNYPEVSRLLDLALKERLTDSALKDKILWYSAWNERRMGHLDIAVTNFKGLDEQTQDDFMRVRALFWLGKSLSEAKQEAEAKSVFERLITLDPLGYYGLLAHRHLDLAISIKPSSSIATTGSELQPAVVAPTPTALPLDTVLAEWLNTLDERDALTGLLEESVVAYRKQNAQTDEGWLTLFKLYAKAGLYTKLYETLGTLDSDRRKTLIESHPELFFPEPWAEEVRVASLQFGVQPELIYAIMRQESAFDPRARSLADAFGLLQVLPEVAESVSQANNIPYEQMEDLYAPQTNIRIGAAHVHNLLKRHNGQFILAVASYNANENAIKNWMKTRFHGDALEFIEEIPYEETRVYVRLVMRNLIFYSLLNSKSASIEFPAWVLKLDAT